MVRKRAYFLVQGDDNPG